MTHPRSLLLVALSLAPLFGCATASGQKVSHQEPLALVDAARQRPVPVELYFPASPDRCTTRRPCPVAFISAGYGMSHKNYSFVAASLNSLGYLAVSVQHDLPSDPPLSKTGDLVTVHTPMWKRGAENLRFVRESLGRSHPQYDWQHLVLIGGSNGGDISSWITRESPSFATAVITLDHRRVPLPRGTSPRVLSIRASDFEADAGVLPTPEEQRQSGTCIVEIAGARHNDMHDGGPAELKGKITALIVGFLGGGSCGEGAANARISS